MHFLAKLDASAFYKVTTVEAKIVLFNKAITEVLDALAPLKKTQTSRKPGNNPLWYDQNSIELKWKCRSYEKAWRKNPSIESWMTYTSNLKLYKAEIRKAQQLYYFEKIKDSKNSAAELFKTANKLANPLERGGPGE